MIPFLDLRRRAAAIRPELDAAIARVLARGVYVLGPEVEGFERAFAAHCGVPHAVGVASGTDALALALRAAGVGAGDEVVTAAATCVPTVAAIVATGAAPVLADVDPRTGTLDPARVGSVLGPRTRAIVPVHLYGRCADVDAIRAAVEPRQVAVVEDASHAHGARLRGRPAGSLGDAAAFSFYPTKNLGALGDGGAVTTCDPELAARVRMLRRGGEARKDEAEAVASHSRLDELQAALLGVQLPHLEAWNRRRRALAARYRTALASTGVTLPGEDEGHVYHLFAVRTPKRDAVRAALAQAGIETRVHYPRAVHEHPAYRELGRPGALVESERLAREVLSLPLYPELADAEAAEVSARLDVLARPVA